MKVRTHGENVLKPKPVKEKDAQKKEGHRRMIEETQKQKIPLVYYRRKTQNHYCKRRNHPQLTK